MNEPRAGRKVGHRHAADFPTSFLPRRVAAAADAAMESVLAEDYILRAHGIGLGRSARGTV